jgi:hypothetical protein
VKNLPLESLSILAALQFRLLVVFIAFAGVLEVFNATLETTSLSIWEV